MRVLHFTPFLELSGAQRSMLVLARAQAEKGDHPVVCVWMDGPVARAARDLGLEVETLLPRPSDLGALGRAQRVLLATRGIAAAVRRHRYALVHSHSAMGNRYVWPAARWTGRPLVTHQRDIWRRDRFHVGLGLADAIVSISHAVQTSLPPRLAARAQVVHNAVFLPTLQPPGERRPGPLRVGMAARCTPEKGHDTFLEAGRRLLSESEIELHLWGLDGSPYAAELRQRVASWPTAARSRVRLEPFRHDADAFYASMDLVVVPSRSPEPFGRVAIEAMAHGKPVVAARHGGLVEIVEEGRTGLFFEAGDASDLHARLREMLADPAAMQRYGAEARRLAELRFAPVAHAAAVERIYRTVL